jgi:hypothetical protein
VVDELLMVGGTDRTDLAVVSFEYLLTEKVQVDVSELRSLLVPGWKDLIKYNCNDIVHELKVSDALLNDLVKYRVMNDVARGGIKNVSTQLVRCFGTFAIFVCLFVQPVAEYI